MFLEDELEYVRLKRNDNIMGWLAIVFVAALVFMFAGVMNSASATGSSSAHRAEAAIAASAQSTPAAAQAGIVHHDIIVAAVHVALPAPASRDVAPTRSGEDQTLALATADDNAGLAHASTARLADHDIKTGALLLSFALMGGSFVMLTFGGPRGGAGTDKREDEDLIDAL